jgi:hypothetical protein
MPGGSAGDVKGQVDRMLVCLSDNARYLTQEIERFNYTLPERAKEFFERRRSEVYQRLGVVEALNIPLRKADAVPAAFSIPVLRKTLPVPKPVPGSAPYRREWTLDDGIYQEILQVIQDTGRVFERLPSTYANKGEEALRDELILQLEPHFSWSSTTAETFNKSGKTDILVWYEKENVFVAECKFWRGRQQHLAPIDQLLKYLTWRDSKTAIIYFVDTKEVVAPLRTIQECTAAHPCFVAFNGARHESHFDFTFHLPGDPARAVQTAVLCFHLPKPRQE